MESGGGMEQWHAALNIGWQRYILVLIGATFGMATICIFLALVIMKCCKGLLQLPFQMTEAPIYGQRVTMSASFASPIWQMGTLVKAS
ncbi:hypothetical protein CO610_08730 [Lysobacteraceae bacterium NML95-0200]|nr:hypothetical protein CO610_08730 [Xanthomonadaceae bacterium NML95-0200]